jgi:dihydroxyacid dehydratase/phosphogluconate dehydratase
VVRRKPEELRSHRWYGAKDLRFFGHRFRTAQMGFDAADYRGKPVIGIINTWSDINPCHTHFRERAEEVTGRPANGSSTRRWSPGAGW